MHLASTLDLAAAKPLWTELSAARTQPLKIDASSVERLGGLCLQVLIAARRAWQADGVAFAIENPSQAFTDAVRLMAGEELMTAEDLA
jgi:chemotaxis protein CheX